MWNERLQSRRKDIARALNSLADDLASDDDGKPRPQQVRPRSMNLRSCNRILEYRTIACGVERRERLRWQEWVPDHITMRHRRLRIKTKQLEDNAGDEGLL